MSERDDLPGSDSDPAAGPGGEPGPIAPDGAHGDPLVLLRLPAEPDALDTAHDALDELWQRESGIEDAVRMRLTMAATEILGNVVEHAYAPEVRAAERRLVFAVWPDAADGALVATISDNGQPVSLDLSDVAMPDPEAESGRGLALAFAALDDLSYGRVGRRNVWTLRCAPR